MYIGDMAAAIVESIATAAMSVLHATCMYVCIQIIGRYIEPYIHTYTYVHCILEETERKRGNNNRTLFESNLFNLSLASIYKSGYFVKVTRAKLKLI